MTTLKKNSFIQPPQYYQVAVGTREDPETCYRLAESYRAIFNYSLAADYYQQTLALDEVNYPVAPFYLALMQKSIGNFKLAKDGFEDFIKTNRISSFIPSDQKDNLIKQAEIEMEGCLWAIEQLGKTWKEIGFTILPEPVNSSNNDYAAVVTENDSVITITSGRRGVRGGLMNNRFGEYFTDNFRYKTLGDTWIQESRADHFDRTNTKFSDGVGAYNSTGNKYYFTSCYEGDAFCKLYVTYKEKGTWKNPQLLNEKVNAPGYDNKHPTLTSGGDTLLFVSNRPGGVGGYDLWYCVSQDGDNWKDPKPLPTGINTPFNEASPFCQLGDLLFFSSEGHIGMGGMDIFMAKNFQSSNPTIQNLGTPFNTGFDDSFFTLGNNKGYLSSNRPYGQGKFDIYSFNLPKQTADVADFLEDPGAKSHLRSRIRTSDGGNLHAARDEDQFYYDNLSAEERARLERILALKQENDGEFDPSTLSKADFKYYNKLDITTKATIERLARRRALEIEGVTAGQMSPQEKLDWEFYHNVDDAEKEVIDRIISARIEVRRNTMSGLSPEEQLYTANSNNQDRIESRVQLKSLGSLAGSLEKQHEAGVKHLDQSNISIESNNLPVNTALVQQQTAKYEALVENLGIEHQLYYQELSPEEKDDLHRSAVHNYITNNGQLSKVEQNQLLAELDLTQDPLKKQNLAPDQYQMSISIRDVLQTGFMAEKQQNLDYPTLMDQLALELEVQKSIVKEQVRRISFKEEDTRNLQYQLQQILNNQGNAEDPAIEQRIVDEIYSQSLNSLPRLSPKDTYYFNTLDPGQKLRLDRLASLIDSQTTKWDSEPGQESDFINEISAIDKWYYQELDLEDQRIINELVANGWNPELPHSDLNKQFIGNLSDLEKDRIDRMITGEKLNLELRESNNLKIVSNEVLDSQNQGTSSQNVNQDEPTFSLENTKEPNVASTAIEAQIYFDFDKHSLGAKARGDLTAFSEYINQQQKPVTVLVEGHTDNTGSEAYNEKLAMMRSRSVADFIKSTSGQISINTKSYGESMPVTDNKSPAARQKNRRVGLVIQGETDESRYSTFLVKPNITLKMIAAATGISEHQIMEWNDLTESTLELYQPLRLPSDLEPEAITNLLVSPGNHKPKDEEGQFHLVLPGESLFDLAQRYHTSVEVLEALNGIDASELLFGQEIKVR